MRQRSRDPWIEEADKLLADGQWHDGLPWMLAVEKHIMPGVAQRRVEADRIRINRRRLERLREQELGRPLTEEEIRQLELRGRTRPLSMGAQIAAGKRRLVVGLVHTKVRISAYEVEPWPVPVGGWKRGGWRLRRPVKWTMKALEGRYRIRLAVIRDLVMQKPALRYEMVGRVMYLPDEELTGLEERIKAYREGSAQRRREASQERWKSTKEKPVTHYSMTTLVERASITKETARKLQQAHPELGWVKKGRRITILPAEQLPAWELVVKQYHSTSGERRSAAARATRARQRTRQQEGDTRDA